MGNVQPGSFASLSHIANPHFHIPRPGLSASLSATDDGGGCRSFLLPSLPGLTVPMLYVSPGERAYQRRKTSNAAGFVSHRLCAASCLMSGLWVFIRLQRVSLAHGQHNSVVSGNRLSPICVRSLTLAECGLLSPLPCAFCCVSCQEDLSLRSCFCVVEGAAKLLFSVPARHDAAFAAHLQSLLPPRSHPLLYRGKSVFFVPDAETIRRFEISIRLCGAGEFVLIDNNVWHCGVNLGVNCSISVNILGAGGVDRLQLDVRAIVDDLHHQRERLVQFISDWASGRLEQSEEEWRVDWNAAVKHLQKQVNIYNSQTRTHTVQARQHSRLMHHQASSRHGPHHKCYTHATNLVTHVVTHPSWMSSSLLRAVPVCCVMNVPGASIAAVCAKLCVV